MTTTNPAVAAESALRLQDVCFSYRPDRLILQIPYMEIAAGQSVFIFGPSGSGKTTLLGLLAGVLKASSGQVMALGRGLSKMSNSQRDHFRGSHVGYIFQMFNLIPYLTVEENIALPCRLDSDAATVSTASRCTMRCAKRPRTWESRRCSTRM